MAEQLQYGEKLSDMLNKLFSGAIPEGAIGREIRIVERFVFPEQAEGEAAVEATSAKEQNQRVSESSNTSRPRARGGTDRRSEFMNFRHQHQLHPYNPRPGLRATKRQRISGVRSMPAQLSSIGDATVDNYVPATAQATLSGVEQNLQRARHENRFEHIWTLEQEQALMRVRMGRLDMRKGKKQEPELANRTYFSMVDRITRLKKTKRISGSTDIGFEIHDEKLAAGVPGVQTVPWDERKCKDEAGATPDGKEASKGQDHTNLVHGNCDSPGCKNTISRRFHSKSKYLYQGETSICHTCYSQRSGRASRAKLNKLEGAPTAIARSTQTSLSHETDTSMELAQMELSDMDYEMADSDISL